MPINPIVLQRRHAELGRIRLGQKGAKGQPMKLDRFRFTSPNLALIEAVAELYGGRAKPWDNGGKAEFEVITDATTVPVIVVKGGLSQWMETWSGGGCTHRCDGIYDAVTGIECDPDSPAHKAAKPTTRLSVMLRDIESMGVWRMESHGYNAAAEIPAMADLAMFVGDLVPAVLHLVERRAVKDGKTSRFVVPVLDLLVSKARLVELASRGGAPVAIAEAPAPAAIAAGPAVNWAELLEDATTPDECRAIWAQAGRLGALTPDLQEAIKAKAAALTQPQAAEPAGPADVDDLWFRIVAAAGGRGLTDSAMREAFERDFGHPVAEGNVAELEAFLHDLTHGAVA